MKFSLKITFLLFFSLSLKAEVINIKSLEDYEAHRDNITIKIKPEEDERFTCEHLAVYFPTIRNDDGIKGITLLTKGDDEKFTSLSRLEYSSASPPRNPPRPGEELPPLTENDRSVVHLCLMKNQIKNSELTITYGTPGALCIGDIIKIQLREFL